MTSDLEREFHQAMINTCRLADNHGYRPTYFLRMLREHGGVNTARRLLRSSGPQTGLMRLWELELLCISLEAHVIRERWASLFTDAERSEARRRLEEYGYAGNSDVRA